MSSPQDNKSTIQSVSFATEEAPIVWSDDNPAAVWTPPSAQPQTIHHPASLLDIKVSLPSYSTLPQFKEPPPQYHPQDISHGGPNFLEPRRSRSILDRQPIKVLAMFIYLLVVYKIATASLDVRSSTSGTLMNWTWPEDIARGHSRDFGYGSDLQEIDGYEFASQFDGWSRSRLGKLGSFSPLLTPSEMNLFVEAEWVLEPSLENEEDSWNKETIFSSPVTPTTTTTPITTSTTTPFTTPTTTTTGGQQARLPLPFHMPSSLFKLSQDMFQQGFRNFQPFHSDSRLLRVFELNP